MKVLFLCKNIILEDHFLDGGVLVDANGKISSILNKEDADLFRNMEDIKVIDVGDNVLMPGIIDTHVHINEPGRTEWEGFETATKAAAAGGITTIADMPLNSIPPTTTVENLRTKAQSAKGNVHVDVAFWGGVVPGNQEELPNMIDAGVVGFKCFLCPSGVDEFPHVNFDEVSSAFAKLENTDVVFAFHAELAEDLPTKGDPKNYDTFLESRQDKMEVEAVRKVIELAKNYNVKTHIVHLSTASALPMIEEAKRSNVCLSVETCPHYLTLHSKIIPSKATQFKCCPPIRSPDNQAALWTALKRNTIDMVVSDHSPSTPDLKLLNIDGNDCGDFMKAWGGIASVQFGLSLFWTESKTRGFTIFDINRYMTRATAKLIGLHTSKGRIAPNYDADFVIWNPDAALTIAESMIHHKNKITPYVGRQLQGKVAKTVVRGKIVYEDGEEFGAPQGKLLLKRGFVY